ncbi:MAG TPA: histidine kinase [Polyangiaceae bacterium]|nr:histidine kinase [Polyangiaceae bacterium]
MSASKPTHASPLPGPNPAPGAVAAAPSQALNERSFAQHRWRRVLTGSAVVVALMLVDAMVRFLLVPTKARTASYVFLWGLEIPVTLVALGVVYRFTQRRRYGALGTLLSTLATAGASGVLFGVALSILAHHFPIFRHPEREPTLLRGAAFGFVFGQLHAGLWAVAFVYPFVAEDARLRALETERLRAAMEAAQLRAHLEPHFLLNTLNAIAGLVTEDPREARRLIACLGDLLRDAARPGHELQTVDQELAWLDRYASILHARHRDALAFRWEISPEARAALVPRLLLQPLVENAVKHGALKRTGGGEVVVRVDVSRDGESAPRVVCTVEDNGPGLGEPRTGSLGLHVVRRRLELNHPGSVLRLESSAEGTRSIVELPFLRTAPAEAAS